MNNPKTMSNAELLKTYELYKGLQSKGVGDEVYIWILENEMDKRGVTNDRQSQT